MSLAGMINIQEDFRGAEGWRGGVSKELNSAFKIFAKSAVLHRSRVMEKWCPADCLDEPKACSQVQSYRAFLYSISPEIMCKYFLATATFGLAPPSHGSWQLQGSPWSVTQRFPRS